MATTVQGISVPYNPFVETSLPHKLTISRTHKFKCRASTATFHGLKTTSFSVQKISQTHFPSIPKTQNDISLKPEGDADIASVRTLLDPNSVSDCRQIHAQLVKSDAFKSNSSVGNKLAITYVKKNESLDDARKLFDEIPVRSVAAYAVLIVSYCRMEKWEDFFSMFHLMVNDGMLPDKYMVPTVLKALAAMKLMMSGRMIHGYVIRKGLDSDVFVGNALIDLYANCGDLRYSRNVFVAMRERDVVSWTALVSAYMEEGRLDEGMRVFRSMQSNGVKPDLISWNALVSGFAKNGKIELALKVLEEMQKKWLKPKVNTWNGLISGCVQSGCFDPALDVFNMMLCFAGDPNFVTIASILPACAGSKDLNLGRAIHGYALKCELCRNIHVEGSLIYMYSKCGAIDFAEKVFVNVKSKSTALWNEMIAAHMNEGNMNDALGLLRLMQAEGVKPDEITYNTVLARLAKKGQKYEAYELLSEMIQMGLKPNVISFNALISGFQQSGLSYEALRLFWNMQFPLSGRICNGMLDVSIQPNSITTAGALAACADLQILRQGKELHGYILRKGFELNIYVSSALADMYAKCHDMVSATKVFRITGLRNAICWNSLIAGHVDNMQPELALKVFHEMLIEGLEPSLITFVIVLHACGDMKALRLGRELHGYIIKSQFDDSNNALALALSDMYVKCGNTKDARLVFDSMLKEMKLCGIPCSLPKAKILD